MLFFRLCSSGFENQSSCHAFPEDEPNSLRPWGRGAGDGEGKIRPQRWRLMKLCWFAIWYCACVHVRTSQHPPNPPMLWWSGDQCMQGNDKWYVLMARQSYFLPGPVLQAITQRCRVTPPAASAKHACNQRKLRRCHGHFSSHVLLGQFVRYSLLFVDWFIPSLVHSFLYLCSGQVNILLF